MIWCKPTEENQKWVVSWFVCHKKKRSFGQKKKNHNVFELIFLKCKMEENFSLRLVVKSKNNFILIYSECGAVSNEVGNMYVCLNLIFTTSM